MQGGGPHNPLPNPPPLSQHPSPSTFYRTHRKRSREGTSDHTRPRFLLGNPPSPPPDSSSVPLEQGSSASSSTKSLRMDHRRASTDAIFPGYEGDGSSRVPLDSFHRNEKSSSPSLKPSGSLRSHLSPNDARGGRQLFYGHQKTASSEGTESLQRDLARIAEQSRVGYIGQDVPIKPPSPSPLHLPLSHGTPTKEKRGLFSRFTKRKGKDNLSPDGTLRMPSPFVPGFSMNETGYSISNSPGAIDKYGSSNKSSISSATLHEGASEVSLERSNSRKEDGSIDSGLAPWSQSTRRRASLNKPENIIDISLPLNLEDMEGIIDKNAVPSAISLYLGKKSGSGRSNINESDPKNNDLLEIAPWMSQMQSSASSAEPWSPPESWGVQLPTPPNILLGVQEEEEEDDVNLAEGRDWNYDINNKNYCIRIFRSDGTFATVSCSLNTTTAELCQMLARKFFVNDISKYSLYVRRHSLERALQAHERPLLFQKRLLERMGYTDQDNIEDLGREDNSYLLRFTFGQATILQVPLEDEIHLKSFQYIDLQSRNLPTIPIFLYKHAKEIFTLNMSKNYGLEIPMDFAQMCTSLRELLLSHNDMRHIPSSLQHIETLTHLDLSNNRLRDVELGRLDALRELTNLWLYNNRLETIPSGFERLEQLCYLNLSNNYFSTFPLVITKIVTLEQLDISFNKLTQIPEEIGRLASLRRLLLVGNQISGSLPKALLNLVELRELDLRQNLITDIGIVSRLPKLEVLLCDYNNISVLQTGFLSLRELSLKKNHLTQFDLVPTAPVELGSWNLTYLNLASSKLTSLPESLFEHVATIERLVLDNNHFVTLPSSISKLTRLTYLSCQNNVLARLPSELSSLSHLKVLEVHQNNLKALPKELWLCGSLETLNASSNLLDSFPAPPTTTTTTNDNVLSASTVTTPRHSLTLPDTQNDGSEQEVTDDIFNPPSIFSSPRNHPPPLAFSLHNLFLGDNLFTDDVFVPLSVFTELRVLNLSLNKLFEIPPESLCHQHLQELYLSGNHLTSLPVDDIEKLSYLRVLCLNGNKLQTLPAELGKLRKLVMLDVGNNMLKYNITNWPYDWNWNWNLGLKYLNLSGNKRLEIKHHYQPDGNSRDKHLAEFGALTRMRVLGLMDVTLMVSVPDETEDRRIRTSASEVNNISYGMADTLGRLEHLTTWDVVVPRFRGRDDECLFALFDGHMPSDDGCRLTKNLSDRFTYRLITELRKVDDQSSAVNGLRRTFLNLNRELGPVGATENSGASALVVYISGSQLYVANVGDALAVVSRDGVAHLISQKHIPWNPNEVARIRNSGGYVSPQGLLNGELEVSRSYGHYDLLPAVNANPYIESIELSGQDEFVIMASRALWDRITYQTAVDVARSQREDLMLAAQKLRDFAITYGADENVMVMVIGIGDMFHRRDRRLKVGRGGGATGRINGRPGNYEVPGDSMLARLGREVEPPVGQVALVFTDIKNSTLLWETMYVAMRSAIKTHNSIMRRLMRTIGGYEVKTEGDAFIVSFPSVTSALLWCFNVQLQLLEADWPQEILESEDCREIIAPGTMDQVIYRGLSVRMGVHWGTPVCEVDPITQRMDYFGPMVNRASRICSVADGGQICISRDVLAEVRALEGLLDEATRDGQLLAEELARDVLALKGLGFGVMRLGERKLKGLETPEEISLVYPKALAMRVELLDSAHLPAAAADQGPIDKHRVSLPPSRISFERTQQISKAPPEEISPQATVEEQEEVDISSPMFDPNLIRSLGYLCLRLERVASGNPTPPNSRQDYMHGLLTFHVRDDAEDEQLLRIFENLVTRIENAASTLYLAKVGRFARVLETLGELLESDPDSILKVLRVLTGSKEAEAKKALELDPGDDFQLPEAFSP
ncbi:uncharacterized protein VTP21DRAFT_5944 [Calcarisporiella thermophila]|uniref:uncharacterized protein n=1 Tax=Calcarisporiella thermophila TaxID=911321 RepID=UPI0037423FA9